MSLLLLKVNTSHVFLDELPDGPLNHRVEINFYEDRNPINPIEDESIVSADAHHIQTAILTSQDSKDFNYFDYNDQEEEIKDIESNHPVAVSVPSSPLRLAPFFAFPLLTVNRDQVDPTNRLGNRNDFNLPTAYGFIPSALGSNLVLDDLWDFLGPMPISKISLAIFIFFSIIFFLIYTKQ